MREYQPGTATTSHRDAPPVPAMPGKQTRSEQLYASAARPPLAPASAATAQATSAFNQAASTVAAMNGQALAIGTRVSGLFDGQSYLQQRVAQNAAAQASEQAAKTQLATLWRSYQGACWAYPQTTSPRASAALPRLPPGAAQVLTKLSAQIRAAQDFLEYLDHVGESLIAPYERAEELQLAIRAAVDAQTAYQNALRLVMSAGEADDTDADDTDDADAA